MHTDVSIILISHNKYPQNLFTLWSLQNQEFDLQKMEVILVDDCSGDITANLQYYPFPFPFKYLCSEQRLDRAGAKNLGLREARGKVIIFLDAEILVGPDFVAKHLRHYENSEEKIAVSGTTNHYCTFSVIHPNFSKSQLGHLLSFIREKPLLLNRLAGELGTLPGELQDYNKFAEAVKKKKAIIPLLSKEDIYTQRYKELSFHLPSFPQVMEKFDDSLTGYHLAWTFFITRNVSVRKSLLDSVGPFNEKFRGWGYEDWELGYRLYKSGVKILEDREIFSYHQEHPFLAVDRSGEQMFNFLKLINLHPDIEVCALTLDLAGKKSLLEVNEIINDYYLLNNRFPKRYPHLKEAFFKLTRQIPFLLANDIPFCKLMQWSGLEKEPGKKKKLFAELESLQKTGKFNSFVNAVELLTSL